MLSIKRKKKIKNNFIFLILGNINSIWKVVGKKELNF